METGRTNYMNPLMNAAKGLAGAGMRKLGFRDPFTKPAGGTGMGMMGPVAPESFGRDRTYRGGDGNDVNLVK